MTETFTDATTHVELLYVFSGLVVLWIGWIKAVRPKLRRFGTRVSAVLDTFGGRDEIEDEVTGQRLPAVLPLHRRLTRMEDRQLEQGQRLDRLATVIENQTEIFRITTDHESRIQSLEDIDAERTLTREEAVEMWRALNSRDVIDVDQEGSAR